MSRIPKPRTRAMLLAALAPVLAGTAAIAATSTPVVPISALHNVRVTSQPPLIPVFTHEGEPHEIYNIPPLNGFAPWRSSD